MRIRISVLITVNIHHDGYSQMLSCRKLLLLVHKWLSWFVSDVVVSFVICDCCGLWVLWSVIVIYEHHGLWELWFVFEICKLHSWWVLWWIECFGLRTSWVTHLNDPHGWLPSPGKLNIDDVLEILAGLQVDGPGGRHLWPDVPEVLIHLVPLWQSLHTQ